jgi:hypothetical protein
MNPYMSWVIEVIVTNPTMSASSSPVTGFGYMANNEITGEVVHVYLCMG